MYLDASVSEWMMDWQVPVGTQRELRKVPMSDKIKSFIY
ncbi:hypothetical protein DGWBC_1342 [Dehalogenimonas sp. WBC-2]|nr:hypothetical protein DGWBC_1342 [Dehalogenimonas sp. WBC-2]